MEKFTATIEGERATTYLQVVEQARLWNPPFVISNDIKEVAELINIGHEDYPKRVPKTLDMLDIYTADEEIMPVHRWQNIVFDLTGEELTAQK